MTHRRLMALVVAGATVLAGLAVRAVVEGRTGKYAGDLLYTVVVYALVVSVAPRVRPDIAAAVAFGVSALVELFQLTGVPDDLADHSRLARLVLGTTFNAPDLLWYAVGAAVAGLVDAATRPAREIRTRPRG